MKTEIFTLCDAATEGAGKLNILGSFDTLFSHQEPMVYPGCALVLKLRFSRIEEGNHKLKITFIDDDGKAVMQPLENEIPVGLNPKASTATTNVILNIQQLKLPHFGEYAISLAVDGREEMSLPLYVIKVD